MHIFKRIYYRSGDPWKWLFCIVLPSALPIGVSLIAAINTRPIPATLGAYININDVIFMGLSIAISNLSVWRSSDADSIKDVLQFLSAFLMVFLCVCLGMSYSGAGLSIPIKIFVVLLVLISSAISLEVTFRTSSNSKQEDS